MFTPIEAHLRADEDPSGWVLVVRGRPLTVDSLSTAAARTLAEFSWHGEPFAAVSGEVTGPTRRTEDVLAGPRLRTPRTYATAPVADVVAGGFRVLPTFAAPHVSIVRPNYDRAHLRALLAIFGPEQTNPFYLGTHR